jgi:4-hydroxy-3-methylbut-2-en-1-yl diphosphate synthase IspG/GcpE
MKSAIGIGALLMDGLGDTIRVSLTGALTIAAAASWVLRGGGERRGGGTVWEEIGTGALLLDGDW